MSFKPQLTEVIQNPDEQIVPPRRGVSSLLGELRKRRVCRTAISYVLVLWLNLQIGDVIFPMIGLPDWSLSLIIIIGVMGFPVVLILGWAFQVTPEGIVLDKNAQPESRTEQYLSTVVNVLLLIFAIVLSGLLLMQFLSDNRTPLVMLAPSNDTRELVVSQLSIEPTTQEAALLASGIREEVRHRLINLEGIEILPSAVELESTDKHRQLALSGSLLLDGTTAHVLAHVIDLSAGRYLTSIAFNIEVESTLTAETAAAERIVEEINRTVLGDQDVSADARTAANRSSNKPMTSSSSSGTSRTLTPQT